MKLDDSATAYSYMLLCTYIIICIFNLYTQLVVLTMNNTNESFNVAGDSNILSIVKKETLHNHKREW